MRIIARLNIGGPAIHVINLNAGLDCSRYAPLLVTGMEAPHEGSLKPQAVARRLRVAVLPELGREIDLAKDFATIWKLFRIIRREKPHIVHTHTAKAGFVGRAAARLAGAPVVCHTFHGHVLRGYFGPAKSRLFTLIEKFSACLSDRLITLSDLLKNDLIAMGIAHADKIMMAPLGLELKDFGRSQRGCGEFRSELKLDKAHKLVAVVGRLVKIKNIHLFIDAARIARQHAPEARFAVIGDGELRSELERHVHSIGMNNAVHFTGWRRDLANIYPDLDAVVNSSDNEGTPVSLIEAMAAGCPVVATKVGGVPDLLERGQFGRLTPQGDSCALAEAILEVFREPELTSEMVRKARDSVLKRYSIERLVSDMDQLYMSLLTAKGICL
jgi:glycosyltransferase involved in cell wall biosynthesis